MINPYYIYISGFVISLLVYQLGWSTLFPELQTNLVVFLVVSMVVAFLLGFYFHLKRFVSFRPIQGHSRMTLMMLFIAALWAAEFAYNGGIPLTLIMTGAEYDYTQYGIPSVHVFVVTFTSFYSIYLFHVYLSTRNKTVLLYYFFTLVLPILIFNRGMLMINLISSIFVYLQFVRRISFGKIALLSVFFIAVLYVFGVLGNIRISKSQETEYSSEYMLNMVSADEEFVNGTIPTEYIWSYLYISSPIGNLQHNITQMNEREVTAHGVMEFVNSELLFDFISKRLAEPLGLERVSPKLFIESLMVASVYTNSYIYLGWTGLIAMALFILTFPIFYLSLIRKHNVFYVTATSILGSLYMFLIFDNMFAFSGLSFQLIYPLLLGRFLKEEQPAGAETDQAVHTHT